MSQGEFRGYGCPTRIILQPERKQARKGEAQEEAEVLCADTKYNVPLDRFYLDKKHIRAQMPQVSTKTKKRAGRPRAFDKAAYDRIRSTIERFNKRVNQGVRRVAIRYDRLPHAYMEVVHLALIVIYLRILQ